jgi:hypothetical protein
MFRIRLARAESYFGASSNVMVWNALLPAFLALPYFAAWLGSYSSTAHILAASHGHGIAAHSLLVQSQDNVAALQDHAQESVLF